MDATEFATAELKKTLEGLARHLFGSEIQTRWGAHLLRKAPVAYCSAQGFSVLDAEHAIYCSASEFEIEGFQMLTVEFPGCLKHSSGCSWCSILGAGL